MAYNLRNRSFLKLQDFNKNELLFLLKLAADLKAAKYTGTEVAKLSGKQIALIFEKASTRTRVSFEVAAYDQGAHVTYLGPTGTQIGNKESMKDTARVLGRIYDGIEYRGFAHHLVETLAQYSGVPVFNGLTNEYHPTQTLADVLTMQEHCDKPLTDMSICYMGDTGNNVGATLYLGAAILGMDVRLCGHKDYWPDKAIISEAKKLAEKSGARLLVTDDVDAGLSGSDFVYTDVWLSMGEAESLWKERIDKLLPYQVNAAAMAKTNNADAKFLHCLPAFHNTETKIGKKIFDAHGLEALEVTEEVFESPASLVFDQAENRLHTIKAIMIAALGQ